MGNQLAKAQKFITELYDIYDWLKNLTSRASEDFKNCLDELYNTTRDLAELLEKNEQIEINDWLDKLLRTDKLLYRQQKLAIRMVHLLNQEKTLDSEKKATFLSNLMSQYFLQEIVSQAINQKKEQIPVDPDIYPIDKLPLNRGLSNLAHQVQEQRENLYAKTEKIVQKILPLSIDKLKDWKEKDYCLDLIQFVQQIYLWNVKVKLSDLEECLEDNGIDYKFIFIIKYKFREHIKNIDYEFLDDYKNETINWITENQEEIRKRGKKEPDQKTETKTMKSIDLKYIALRMGTEAYKGRKHAILKFEDPNKGELFFLKECFEGLNGVPQEKSGRLKFKPGEVYQLTYSEFNSEFDLNLQKNIITSIEGEGKNLKELSPDIKKTLEKAPPGKIFNLTPLPKQPETKKETEDDWKDIHPDFTLELRKYWEKGRSFTKDQVKDWINTGLTPGDADFAAWLEDEAGANDMETLSHEDLENFRVAWYEAIKPASITTSPLYYYYSPGQLSGNSDTSSYFPQMNSGGDSGSSLPKRSSSDQLVKSVVSSIDDSIELVKREGKRLSRTYSKNYKEKEEETINLGSFDATEYNNAMEHLDAADNGLNDYARYAWNRFRANHFELIQNLQQRLDVLNKEQLKKFNMLEEQLRLYQDDTSKLEESFEERGQTINYLNEEIRKLKTDKTFLEGNEREFKIDSANQIQKLIKELQEKAEEIKKLENKIDRLELEDRHNKTQRGLIEREKNEIQELLGEATKNLVVATRAKERAERERNARGDITVDDLTALQTAKNTAERDLATCTEELRTATETLANRGNITPDELTTLREEKDAAETALTTATENLTARTQELTEMTNARNARADITPDDLTALRGELRTTNDNLTTATETLTTRTTERDEAIRERNARGDITVDDLTALQTAKNTAERDLATCTEELRTATETLANRGNITPDELTTLREEKDAAETALTTATENLTARTQELTEMTNARNARADITPDDLTALRGELRTTNDNLTTATETLTTRTTERDEAIRERNARGDITVDDLTALQTAKNTAERDLATCTEELRTATETLANRGNITPDELTTLREEKDAAETALTTATENLTARTQELTEMTNARNARADITPDDLTALRGELRTTNDNLTTATETLTTRTTERDEAIRERNARGDITVDDLTALQTAKNTAERDLATCTEELRTATETLANRGNITPDELTTLREEKDAAETALTTATENLTARTQELTEMTNARNARADITPDDLTALRGELRTTNDNLTTATETLTTRTTERDEAIRERNARGDITVDDLTALRNERDDIKNKLRASESDLSTIESYLNDLRDTSGNINTNVLQNYHQAQTNYSEAQAQKVSYENYLQTGLKIDNLNNLPVNNTGQSLDQLIDFYDGNHPSLQFTKLKTHTKSVINQFRKEQKVKFKDLNAELRAKYNIVELNWKDYLDNASDEQELESRKLKILDAIAELKTTKLASKLHSRNSKLKNKLEKLNDSQFDRLKTHVKTVIEQFRDEQLVGNDIHAQSQIDDNLNNQLRGKHPSITELTWQDYINNSPVAGLGGRKLNVLNSLAELIINKHVVANSNQGQINDLQSQLSQEQQAHQQTKSKLSAIPSNWQQQIAEVKKQVEQQLSQKEQSIVQQLNISLNLNLSEPTLPSAISKIQELINKPPISSDSEFFSPAPAPSNQALQKQLQEAQQTITQLQNQLNQKQPTTPFGESIKEIIKVDEKLLNENQALKIELEKHSNYEQFAKERNKKVMQQIKEVNIEKIIQLLPQAKKEEVKENIEKSANYAELAQNRNQIITKYIQQDSNNSLQEIQQQQKTERTILISLLVTSLISVGGLLMKLKSSKLPLNGRAK